MDSALFAGQIGVAGLSLAGFSTVVDLLHTVKAGLRLWEECSDLDADIEFFRAQVILKRDMLETWQKDWLDFPVGGISSSGRARLLRHHQTSIETTLRSVESELGKLSPLSVLTHVQEDPNTAQRLKWIIGQKNMAEVSLKHVGMLLHDLFVILPLQSRNPEVLFMISLLSSLSPKWSSDIADMFRGGGNLISQGFDLRNLGASLENDLERRVKEFQQSIPGQNMVISCATIDLKLEEGTAGTRSRGLLNNIPIIVEWKSYETWHGQRAILLRGRNDNLARMLNATSKPEELLTFHCKGYFDDIERRQYGFVFDIPAKPGEDLVSLNTLLNKPPPERLPSLEQRYQIAYALGLTISILHATGWLHKGIRSHNVLFVHRGDTIRWARPYLCGFAFSRPDKPDEISEKLEHSERFNVYRHPLAQGQPDEQYRQEYDIYSFGVLLFEIASWGGTFRMWTQDPQAFRRELTSNVHQKKIAHRVGTDYCNVMMKCLDGYFKDKGDSTSALFYSEVIEVLGRFVPL